MTEENNVKKVLIYCIRDHCLIDLDMGWCICIHSLSINACLMQRFIIEMDCISNCILSLTAVLVNRENSYISIWKEVLKCNIFSLLTHFQMWLFFSICSGGKSKNKVNKPEKRTFCSQIFTFQFISKTILQSISKANMSTENICKEKKITIVIFTIFFIHTKK